MKQRLRSWLFAALGVEPEAVVVIIGNRALEVEMARLTADRRRVFIPAVAGETTGEAWLRLRRAVRGLRVALAAVGMEPGPLRSAALLAFPGKVLGFHPNLDRHHLRLRTALASLLFLRGVPLDRIFLRPRWLVPWQTDESVLPRVWRPAGGRGFRAGKPRVAVVSPYCPWPLSHGGAVRIFNLLKESAREFDIVLFAFEDGQTEADFAHAAEFLAELHVAAKPRYRQPRWSTLLPPETLEYYTPELDAGLREVMLRHSIRLLQAEYTLAARYRPDVLVEHDVTFDLFGQIQAATPGLSNWWNLRRWRRFESRALRRSRAVVVMSEKDATLVARPNSRVIGNGVDLERFRPEPEPERTQHLLFIGSFRHFPNVRAYRFFVEEVWPRLSALVDLRVTVVAGPDPELYWQAPPPDERIRMLGFTADVRPLYVDANLVLIPTLVSAGTNLKALEAMAMERAIVSTPSGVAGLGLEHGRSVVIASSAEAFADAILELLADTDRRRSLAAAARQIAAERFGWPALAEQQIRLWRSLEP